VDVRVKYVRNLFSITGLVTDSMLGFKRETLSGLIDVVTHFTNMKQTSKVSIYK